MDEELKQKLLPSAIVFSTIVFLYQIFMNSSEFSFPRLMLGVLLGAVAAGITFGVMHFLQNR